MADNYASDKTVAVPYEEVATDDIDHLFWCCAGVGRLPASQVSRVLRCDQETG